MAKATHKSKFIKWPAPGCHEAVEKGCTCPVLDNNHGAGIHTPQGAVYWVNKDCKIHKKLSDE